MPTEIIAFGIFSHARRHAGIKLSLWEHNCLYSYIDEPLFEEGGLSEGYLNDLSPRRLAPQCI